jgi:[CysO sulfur-carrier protein]-S-L-cysteine hydrolase
LDFPRGLSIPFALWADLLRHVEACLPEEACGFLGGSGGVVERILPVENADHSPVRFRMDGQGQLAAMRDLEGSAALMLGIYHSHPAGPSGLSPTDLDEAAYPEAALVVLSPTSGRWIARAFVVDERSPREIPFAIGGSDDGGEQPRGAGGVPSIVAPRRHGP